MGHRCIITGANSIEESQVLYTEAKKLFNTAYINLASNSKQFMPLSLSKTELRNWNAISDKLSISKSLLQKLRPDKKYYKSFLQFSILLVTTLLPSWKLNFFMRELWVEKCDWDSELNGKQMNKWYQNVQNPETISEHRMPRYVGIMGTHYDEAIQYSLVCFCDASAKVYSAAIYLCQSLSDSCKTDLIFCKTRLAPQNTSIPRLELLNWSKGSEVCNEGTTCSSNSYLCVFSDSLCVFHWLSTKKLPVICEGEENNVFGTLSHSASLMNHLLKKV